MTAPPPAPTQTPDELLAHATPDELLSLEHALRLTLARRSPLDLACVLDPNTRRWPHLNLINDELTAFFDYRLYPDGPGPPPNWYYRPTFDPLDTSRPPDGSDTAIWHSASSIHDIPEQVLSFVGIRPNIPPPPPDPLTGNATDFPNQHKVCFDLDISMHPRAGKSQLIIERLPIWLWLLDPTIDIGLGTYNDDFATGHWGARFRDFLAQGSPAADLCGFYVTGNTAVLEARTTDGAKTGGTFRFVGRGGALTGKGMLVGLLDDPFKDKAEAESAAVRKQADRWYSSVWKSRATRDFRPGARFPLPLYVMVFTRWHQDDLAGRYSVHDDGSPRPGRRVINLPALAIPDEPDPLGRRPGEALVPAVKNRAQLLELQAQDPHTFACLYQGRPVPEEGGMLPSQHQTYTTSDTELCYSDSAGNHQIKLSDCMHFITADLAATKNSWSDWTVLTRWAYHRPTGICFRRGTFRERLTTDEYDQLIPWLTAEPAAFTAGEEISYGQVFAQLLRRQGLSHRSLSVSKDKTTRALNADLAAKIATGRIRLPETATDRFEWEAEHANFPNGRHDDRVDNSTLAATIMDQYPPSTRPAPPAPTPTDEIDRHVDRQARRRRAQDFHRGRSAAAALRGRIGW